MAIWWLYSGLILKGSWENTFPLGRTMSITPGHPLYVGGKNGWRWEYVWIPGNYQWLDCQVMGLKRKLLLQQISKCYSLLRIQYPKLHSFQLAKKGHLVNSSPLERLLYVKRNFFWKISVFNLDFKIHIFKYVVTFQPYLVAFLFYVCMCIRKK